MKNICRTLFFTVAILLSHEIYSQSSLNFDQAPRNYSGPVTIVAGEHGKMIANEPGSFFIPAKDSVHHKPKTLAVKIKLSGNKSFSGYLVNMNDSMLQLISKRAPFGTTPTEISFGYANVISVSIHRKGNIGRGFVIGALSGAAMGALIGAGTYSPNPTGIDYGIGANMAGASLLGGILGGITGTLVGAIGKNFSIKQEKLKFLLMHQKLISYLGQ